MQVTVVGDLDGLLALRDEWQALLARCPSAHVFMTWQWLITWWRHFGRDRTLFVIVVRDRGELIGIVPLALFADRGRFGFRVRYLQFVGYRSSKRWTDYMDIIAVRKEDVVQAAFATLRTTQHLWDVLDLWDILQDSPTIEIVSRAADSLGFPVSNSESDKALYLQATSDWESFYRARARDRREFERRNRRLKEKGHLTVAPADGSDMGPFVDAVLELYGRRWNQPPASLVEHTRFFRDLLQVVPPEWPHCTALRLDGKPIAAHICLRYGHRLYQLITAYDAEYSEFSPGRLHFKDLVQDCFLDPELSECYFGRGTEPYKYEWATGELSVRRLHISNAHSSGHMGKVLRRVPPYVRRPLIAASDAMRRLPRGGVAW